MNWNTTIIGVVIIGLAIVGGYLGSLDKTQVGAMLTTGVGFILAADAKRVKK